MPPISDRRRELNRLAVQRYRKAHPDRVLQSRRASVAAPSGRVYLSHDPEYHKKRHRAYNAANKEKRRASRKVYYEANRDALAKRNRLWRETHKEYERIRHRAWALAFPDMCRAHEARRRALKRGVLATLTALQWKAIKVAYKYRCAYCGVKPKKLTQDHVIPLARGGHHTASNVVPACLPCNLQKGDRLPMTLPAIRLLV